MAVLTFGAMSYCPNYRTFHRHTSYERGLVNFGYPVADVRNLAAYRYDEVESAREAGHSALQWAGPCEDYRDITDSGCARCRETYMSFRQSAAALEAQCFAEGVLARASEGDRLFLVSVPIPMVAVRDKSAYNGRRLGEYQRLSKKKRKAHKRAFERKKKVMFEREGLKVGPEYYSPKRVKERKDAHKLWLTEHKDDYYQLECIKSDVMRSVVVKEDAFIKREPYKSGYRYVLTEGQYRLEQDVARYAVQRVKPPALRWLFKQLEMRIRKLGRQNGFGIKYQAVIEQGKRGGYHYHVLLHVFGCDKTEELQVGDEPIENWQDEVELKAVLEREWFEVSGNVHFETEESDGSVKTWFQRVRSAAAAASYISKYISKGWFSRRQTSKFLNLREAARDARLLRAGFCTEKLSSIATHFKRDTEGGFLYYDSPLEEEDIARAGVQKWVGIEVVPQAPNSAISVPKLNLVAVFYSSEDCRHPAAARSGICGSADGIIQDLIPSCWWFPYDDLVRYLGNVHARATVQVEDLHRQLTDKRYRATVSVLSAVQRSPLVNPEQQFANRDSIMHEGRYPVRLQLDRLQESLSSLPFQINEAFGRLAGARSAFAQFDVKARLQTAVANREDVKASWYRLSGRQRDRMRVSAVRSVASSVVNVNNPPVCPSEFGLGPS